MKKSEITWIDLKDLVWVTYDLVYVKLGCFMLLNYVVETVLFKLLCLMYVVVGTGTIGNSSIYINNVWLVDGLRHNVLSISQFCDNGYDVMFDKTNCTVVNKNDNSIVVHRI